MYSYSRFVCRAMYLYVCSVLLCYPRHGFTTRVCAIRTYYLLATPSRAIRTCYRMLSRIRTY